MTTFPEAATDFELVRLRVRAVEHSTKKRKKSDEPPSGSRSDTRGNEKTQNNNDDDNNEEEVGEGEEGEDNSANTLAPDAEAVAFTLPRHGGAAYKLNPVAPIA
jgi:hypothetical protein